MRRRASLALVAIFAATVVLLADYAYLETSTSVTNDPDPWVSSAITVTAGNSFGTVWVVTGDSAVGVGCGTPTSNQSDTFESTVNLNLATTARLCVAFVCNSVGGSTAVTVTHGTGGAVGDIIRVDEYSGLADSSCVADSDTETESGVTTTTTPAVDTSGAALIYGALVTNQDPTIGGAGSPTERWEATSAAGFLVNVQDKRATGAGSHTLNWTMASAVTLSAVVALNEAAGGAAPSPLPATVRPRGGGGLPLLLSMTQHPFGPRLVQLVRRAR
jgi:hypothetical protein